MNLERVEALEMEIAQLRALLADVLVPVFCLLTGYSDKAVRRKIANGVWIQGKHYRKAPDGRITMDLQAYCRWVES